MIMRGLVLLVVVEVAVISIDGVQCLSGPWFWIFWISDDH
jgi:hypothetical protein